jgi:glycosyltransferase involved in cell wall biosynthesis
VNVHREWRLPYRLIERLVLRAADGAHAPNRDVPEILRAKGFSKGRPTAVIPLGVDVDQFASAEALAGEVETIPRPRVGFVGRLEPVKGLDVLLDAAPLMHEAASLVIVGDGSERGHLTRRARADRRVHLLPAVPFARLPAIVKSFDVLVLPSITILPLHREQFGRVLVEAMAAGVPVIGSTSGAVPEVIGDAGLVVPEGDAAALAAGLDRVLASPELRAQMVARGRARVAQMFAWPIVAERAVELFRVAVAHRRRGSPRFQEVHA